jgi:ketosteroid isomerase-like protein
MTTATDVRRWIDDYVRAWRTPGTEGLVDVFTPDVRYLPSPWAEPIVGLDALALFWDSERDGPDEQFTITYEVVAVDGALGVVRVAVDYRRSRWRDLWVVRFADDGRCREFEEWPFRPGQDDGHA